MPPTYNSSRLKQSLYAFCGGGEELGGTLSFSDFLWLFSYVFMIVKREKNVIFLVHSGEKSF